MPQKVEKFFLRIIFLIGYFSLNGINLAVEDGEVVGILGFVPAVTKDEMLLGIFHVNTAHNAVHLLSGVVALICGMMGVGASRMYFKLFGLVYAAVAVMEDGRHVLIAGPGASRFAREHGVEMADPSIFVNAARHRPLEAVDTVGAVARDADGHLVVAVSTGGIQGKVPGRVGDSPIPGAGLYADDRYGAVCGTGQGEAFIRLALAKLVVVELQHGMDPAFVAKGAVAHLGTSMQAQGGVILIPRDGEPQAAFNTPFMPWASRVG